MKTLLIMCSIAALALSAYAEQPAATNTIQKFNNVTCPVMDGKVSGKNHVVYNNVQYELCCKSCEKTFLKDPAKYLAKLPNDGKIVEAGNTTCPVMGGNVNTNVFTVYNGQKIYFCCPGCDKTFNADPAKYLKKLKSAESAKPEAKKEKELDNKHTN